MANKRSSSNIILSFLVLALVFSPIIQCQEIEMQTLEIKGGENKMPRRFCPACVCCAPAPKGSCCPCKCP
ncbi:unnamed protein product [Cochlearia groenlandica]